MKSAEGVKELWQDMSYFCDNQNPRGFSMFLELVHQRREKAVRAVTTEECNVELQPDLDTTALDVSSTDLDGVVLAVSSTELNTTALDVLLH